MTQENDVGIVIRYTVLTEAGIAKDISTATVKKLIFKRPDGAIVEKDADFTTDGVDGKIEYIVLAGDLTPPGAWRVQAGITMPEFDGRSVPAMFEVLRNL